MRVNTNNSANGNGTKNFYTDNGGMVSDNSGKQNSGYKSDPTFGDLLKEIGKRIKSIFTGRRKPRIYKLRGYTTTSRVDRRVAKAQTKRMIRNFLIAAVFILIIAILLFIFNPLKDLNELFRMIGI